MKIEEALDYADEMGSTIHLTLATAYRQVKQELEEARQAMITQLHIDKAYYDAKISRLQEVIKKKDEALKEIVTPDGLEPTGAYALHVNLIAHKALSLTAGEED